ncbi:MAG: hypothetical protein GXO80_06900 [Chlorobi bacterium]|nr:hypothetical protein [Chlorobiota bacterium]
MLRSAQQAFFVGQRYDIIDYPGVYKRFRNVHNYLAKNNFSGDSENNLVVLDYQSPTPLNKDNFLGHFVFGFNSADVQHVISDGKLIIEDRIVQNVNEKDVMQFAQEQAVRLWEKMNNKK